MTKFAVSVGTWTKIASAGSTVEVQGQYVLLTQSAGVPMSNTDAEVLYGSDNYRKYDTPLPLDLYASFSYSGPSSSTQTGFVEVLPIGTGGGSGGAGGTVQDTAAETALGMPADQPPASPTTSGSIVAKLGGIWTALLGTLKFQSANPSTIVANRQAVTTSAVALPAQALVNGIVLTALSSNAAPINVGPAGVTASTGYQLAPGQSISYGVANLNAIYIIGTSANAASDAVAYTGN